MLRLLISLLVTIVFALQGCLKERITDDTLNRIAECTGGISGSSGFVAKIEARVEESRKAGMADADINYKEIIQGVIFSDASISENLKQFYFTEYQKCLDKARALSEHEQRVAIGLLHSELQHNIYVVTELSKNTETLVTAAKAIAEVLRIEKLKINYGLFPPENIDTKSKEDADLYNQRMEWLLASGLLNNSDEVRKFREQNAAIVRTIDRTLSTVRSLGDRTGVRYVVRSSAYEANLPILRKVTKFDVENLASLYAKTSEVREKYFRVAMSVEEYLLAVREYCSQDTPERKNLGAVLAAERLTLRLLDAHRAELLDLANTIEEHAQSMEIRKNGSKPSLGFN